MKYLIMILTLISTISIALSPQPITEMTDAVYHNATVHIGNGKVMEGATLVIEKGRISRIGYYKMSWQKSDIDLKGKHIYPGFILPVTNIGLNEIGAVKATIDDNEVGQMNPNVRAIVAYNTDSELPPTLKYNGVLLAQTTPQGGLVSGLSSIVQLDAWNWQDAAVVTDDAVHVNWPSIMQAKFDFATFTMKTEKNKKYSQQLNQIKSLFDDAKMSLQKSSNPMNLKLGAVIPVFSGQRKVYIHTDDAKAIIASINYFQEVGVKNIVLVTAQGSEPVIGFIKQSGVAVIVSSTHDLPQRSDSSVDSGYTMANKLHNAGVLVALAYPGIMSSRNLAFTAGTLVSYGMEKEQALQLITGNTAKILGIDKDYGTLEAGKSATLIITDGDALDMRGNKVLEAYIDGRKINLQGRQQELNQRYLQKYGIK